MLLTVHGWCGGDGTGADGVRARVVSPHRAVAVQVPDLLAALVVVVRLTEAEIVRPTGPTTVDLTLVKGTVV